jgi:DNA-binding protein YbaB
MQGNVDDFNALTQRTRQVADDLAALGRSLSGAGALGIGGAGLVRAHLAANGRVTDVDIDATQFDPGDLHGLGEAIAEAVNAALDALTAQRAEQISHVTGGMAEILDTIRAARATRPE